MGLDAVWSDDFHHAVHAVVTGERDGYYSDYGRLWDVAECLEHGFCYRGRYSVYRRRSHGRACDQLPPSAFVCCVQNHDQIGNRVLGERLASLVNFETLKLAAALLLLGPHAPLLFMGEEHGETAPFPYFVSHHDSALVEAVRAGRREEFAAFAWKGEPLDPQDPATFARAKLDWGRREAGQGKQLLDWHKALLRLRREQPALARLRRENCHVWRLDGRDAILMHREFGGDQVLCLFNLGGKERGVDLEARFPAGRWRVLLDSARKEWGGPGSLLDVAPSGVAGLMPRSAAVLHRGRR